MNQTQTPTPLQPTPGPQATNPQNIQPLIQPRPNRRHDTFHEPSRDEKDSLPSRYLGYRVFCKWVASDQTYLIVRKFSTLNVRIILSLQDEIVKLEQELNELDEDWSRVTLPDHINHPDPDTIHNGTFRADDVRERTKLIRVLSGKIQRYSMSISIQMMSFFSTQR
jgi:hypothetical protein